MKPTMAEPADRRHPLLPDIGRPVMAKAHAQDPDIDWRQAIGAAIQQAVKDAGLSNKEAAAAAKVDDAEFGKWVNGTRRPQLDRLMPILQLRRPLIVNFARLGGKTIRIETVIRVEDETAA